MSLANDFLVGADPEFVIVENGHLQKFNGRVEPYVPWGTDHGNWVVEPHPKPELSVRQLIQNLKVSLNDFATVAPAGKWRAGAALTAPERRVTMGGHIHFDKQECSTVQCGALDMFIRHMEALDVLPQRECAARREGGAYGRYGDVRNEHGHFEYRTPPSWLFSQRVTKLCLIGTKLLMSAPDAIKELGSLTATSHVKLKKFFEVFKGKDEDADWLLTASWLGKTITVDPEKDLRTVWKVEPKKEDPHWKAAKTAATTPGISPVYPYCFSVPYLPGVWGLFYKSDGTSPSDIERELLSERLIQDGPPPSGTLWLTHGRHVFIGLKPNGMTAWDGLMRTQSYRTIISGTRYRWKLLENQVPGTRTSEILRGYVMALRPAAGTVGQIQLMNGLLFQCLGPETPQI